MTNRTVLTLKLLVCGAAILGAAAFVAHLLWPTLAAGSLALYVLAGLGLLGGLLVLAHWAVGGWLNQWVLRRGGTDTQWLWFAADPPGRVGQRQPHQSDTEDA
jgi:hypothetical protein